ncbi:MAG: putative baseplate assembly protein [Pseudomonas sp.]|uniref:putative baseplate assembly protein n=1 Tax=Pseudomonas sp. TaxID=306 RepID=UPI0033935791
MKRQFRSDNPHRLQLLRDLQPPSLNGIDYLEVTSKDQRSLKLVFVHPVFGLTLDHCRIDGGVRIRGIRIESLTVNGKQLEITVDRAGDFSWYDFVLLDPAAPDEVPAGFDPCLSSIRFSFKAQCPSEFDCAEESACLPTAPLEPLLDYLAKDFSSFRRLMLDRMGQLIPGFQERDPADFSVALVEMLAYVGDQLSYYQDAVATEAYLGTARRRVSLRRHARLLGYPIHDGCNSRVHVTLEVRAGADGQSLPARSRLLTRGVDNAAVVRLATLELLPDANTQVFETLHALRLQSSHNRIRLHAWGDTAFCLGRGALEAALVDEPALALEPGMVMILEEVLSPTLGTGADADRSHRHPVRLVAVEPGFDALTQTPLQLVRWHEEDALPFALCVSAEFEQGGAQVVREIAVARGNVVLADHGLSRAYEALLPATVPLSGKYRPRLGEFGIAYAEPYAHQTALETGWSARRALRQDPRRARPADMQLLPDDPDQFGNQPLPGGTPWRPQRDLLGSDRFAQEFVVETEADGAVYLRFGDNRFGLQPEPGSRLLASYRQGGGSLGNVGADSITRLVSDDLAIAPFVDRVRNPLAAQGGAEPESAEAVKLFAPEAFRSQERAVTEEDYARAAERHPEVQRAAARLRWTGSWYTVFVSLDRKDGKPLDAPFRAQLLEHLETFRLAGYDLDLSEPVYVALDIELTLCVLPGYFAAAVKLAVLRRLASVRDEQGQRGFFHPDHFTFGQGLALSRLIAAVQTVPGVASVEVLRFQRWGKTAKGEREEGLISAAALEVLRLDNDPNFPENGRLRLNMRGGL